MQEKIIKGVYCILPEFERVDEYKKYVHKICNSGVDIVQLRIKNLTDFTSKYFYQVATVIREITKKYRKIFIVNDRLDIAIASNADGVHLGQDDLPVNVARQIVANILRNKKFLIGYSTHSLSQARQAIKLPIDYISIGPVFATNTKPDYSPVGVEVVKQVCKLVNNKKYIVAVGGINETNVRLLSDVHIDAICTMSGLYNTKNLISTIKLFKSVLLKT